jgi:hypothetical protein
MSSGPKAFSAPSTSATRSVGSRASPRQGDRLAAVTYRCASQAAGGSIQATVGHDDIRRGRWPTAGARRRPLRWKAPLSIWLPLAESRRPSWHPSLAIDHIGRSRECCLWEISSVICDPAVRIHSRSPRLRPPQARPTHSKGNEHRRRSLLARRLLHHAYEPTEAKSLEERGHPKIST